MSVFGVADSLVDRLAHGQDRHGQRWDLHLPSEDEMTAQIRPLLFLLGLPTFGLALAISVLTTFGPVILIRLLHSPASVGALIGAEGALALVVPITAGSLSDRLSPSPLGPIPEARNSRPSRPKAKPRGNGTTPGATICSPGPSSERANAITARALRNPT